MNGLKKNWRDWAPFEPGHLPLCGIALSLTLIAYFWRLGLLRVRDFDPDEFEHLHAAWLISKGMLPYRDFFEHHTPWFYFFLAPFYAFFDVETNVQHAHAFLFFARTWMWLFAGMILGLTLCLGRLWRDTRVGCVAALFLGNTIMFLSKTLEVRPDVLSVAFLLACLATTVYGIREELPNGGTGFGPQRFRSPARWRFMWSGVFLGAAVMCTQKVLFALPGLALAMLWYVADSRSNGTYRQRIGNLAFQIAGFSAPIFLTLGYFALRGGLDEFIGYNVLLNARWKVRFSPKPYLVQLVKENPIFVALAIVGFLRAFLEMFSRERFRRAEFVYALNALGLFVGVFIIPVPYRQYYQMFLPLMAVFAAGILVDTADSIAAALRGARVKNSLFYLPAVVGTVVFVALLRFALKLANSRILNDWFYSGMWSVALAATILLLVMRQKNFALGVVIIALSVYPFTQMHALADWKNTEALDEIRYVLENTAPTETCMDGWTGRGVFRPHAWFYWFLHSDIRPMLADESKNQLLSGLESGIIAPKLLFYDEDLKGLSQKTARFFEEHYESAGIGSIWRRK